MALIGLALLFGRNEFAGIAENQAKRQAKEEATQENKKAQLNRWAFLLYNLLISKGVSYAQVELGLARYAV
jgi:hypothetical protein